MKKLSLITVLLVLTACLKTRSDVKEIENKVVIQDQVVTLQKNNADSAGRFAEIEEQIRNMNGQIEVLENNLKNQKTENENLVKGSEAQQAELHKKIQLLQDEISKLDSQNQNLDQELKQTKSQLEQKAGSDKSSGSIADSAADTNLKKSNFEIADDFFKKKDWKKSILLFQKYRDENPQGKKYVEATYKMGVSFLELGMKEEAITFFNDVVTNHPKSDFAKQAKAKMKGLKKK